MTDRAEPCVKMCAGISQKGGSAKRLNFSLTLTLFCFEQTGLPAIYTWTIGRWIHQDQERVGGNTGEEESFFVLKIGRNISVSFTSHNWEGGFSYIPNNLFRGQLG